MIVQKRYVLNGYAFCLFFCIVIAGQTQLLTHDK